MVVRSYSLLDPADTKTPDTIRVRSMSGTAVDVPLQVKRATIALDATWSPFAQSTFVCAIPATSVLALIDPRRSDNLRVVYYPAQSIDGTPLNSLDSFTRNLMLRTRSVDYSTRELTLTAYSDECQMMDYVVGVDQTLATSSTTLDAVQILATNVSPGVQFPGLLQTVPPYPSVAAADLVWPAGVSMWDYLQALYDANNMRQFVDDSGAPHHEPVGYSYDTSTHYLNDASAIITVQDSISRDSPLWGNYAVVLYEGTAPPYAVASAASTGGNNVRKTILQHQRGKKPTTGNAATKLAANIIGRGQQLMVTALADFDAYPNQTWSVAYADQSHAGTLQAVTFNLPEGTMSMTINVTS